jgi:hypothetical protein
VEDISPGPSVVLANGIHAHFITLHGLLIVSCLCTASRLPPFPASAGKAIHSKAPAISLLYQRNASAGQSSKQSVSSML